MPVTRPRPQTNPYASRQRRGPALPGPARDPLDGPADVFAYVHKYPPVHNAGAEWMLHTMLRHLVAAGHRCRVVADVDRSYRVDGVRVDPDEYAEAGFQWCDVAVTHLDRTAWAVRFARRHKRPLIHLVHNDSQLAYHGVGPADASLVVWNSRWMAAAHADFPARSTLIVRPPVTGADYRTGRSAATTTTLVNMTREKGAAILFHLARSMPDDGFLGIRGAYGRQMDPPRGLANLAVEEQTPRIRDVYARTKILIVPSGYESWGRVAVEASASGIPVVASPTPGLVEALGTAGIFVELDDLAGWVDAVRELTVDVGFYRERSLLARARSAELDIVAADDLDVWTGAVLRCAAAGRRFPAGS